MGQKYRPLGNTTDLRHPVRMDGGQDKDEGDDVQGGGRKGDHSSPGPCDVTHVAGTPALHVVLVLLEINKLFNSKKNFAEILNFQIFIYFFGRLECVGDSFMSPILYS
jgi:hypothetical protein